MLSQKIIIKENPRALYISYDGILDPVGESQVIPYLRGLAKDGVSIFLISFEKKQRINRVSLHSYRETLAKEGIRWEALTYHKRPIIPATLFDVLRGIFKGWSLIKSNGIKIIHARGYIPGIIAYFLKMLTKAKFIFDTRGFWPEEKVDAGAWDKRGIFYNSMKYVEKKMVLFSDDIIVLTEAARKIIANLYNKRANDINVIPCCVDLEVFSPGLTKPLSFSLPGNRLVIGYIGSIGTFYNFEETVKFFMSFKSELPEGYLLILANSGKGQVLNVLEKFHIRPEDYSIFSVANKEVPLFLSRCAFSLIFYRRALSGAGCCPIKFAESLACGVPVIINHGIGDCSRIVEEEGIGVVLKEYSFSEYKEVIPKIKALLERRREVAERCRITAKKYFSLSNGVKEYFSLYEKLNQI
jgi:glycosyltransferase involved in cell wall biosynthesis